MTAIFYFCLLALSVCFGCLGVAILMGDLELVLIYTFLGTWFTALAYGTREYA